MAIRVKHGNIEDIMVLADAVRQTQQSEREIARGEAVAGQIRQIEASKELAEFNAQLAIDKMKFNAQFQVERDNRAMAFELEKEQMKQVTDFAREERKRNEALDQWEATDKYLNEHAEDFDEGALKQARFDNYARLQGRGYRGSPMKDSDKKKSVFNLLGDEQPAAGTNVPSTSDPAGLNIPTGGKVKQLESPETQQLIKDKKFKVVSPDGDQEIIESADWPKKKEQGYLLAEIVNLRQKRQSEKAVDAAAVRMYTGMRF